MAPCLLRFCVLLAGLVLAAQSLPEPKHLEPGECVHQFRHLNSCDDAPTNTETNGISAGLLADMHLMAEHAAAVYLLANNNSTGTPLTCTGTCPGIKEGSCPQVEAAGATTITEFKDTPRFDDHGYIAIDKTNGIIVLAFRGTRSLKNWFENVKAWRSASDLCGECHIHAGFWEQWTSIRHMIMPNVDKAIAENPEYRFIVTGHSLGGALATIAAADFRHSSDWFLMNTELFSYGSPRIGDFLAVRFLSEQSKKSYRVTASDDPIARLPLTSLGYMHTSPEYFIARNPNDPKPEDVTVLTGYYNSHGDSGQDPSIFKDLNNHRHYFGRLPGCDKAAGNEDDERINGDDA